MSDPTSENTSPRLPSNGTGEEISDAHLQDVHAQLLREKPEPGQGTSSLPVFFTFFFVFAFSGLIFFGGVYMAKYSGSFSALAFDETVHLARGEVAEVSAGPDPLVLGKRLYTQNCMACHMESGMGLAPVFPPLAGSEWVLGSEQRPIRIVMFGLGGEIQVKGAIFNGVMPSFGPTGLGWSDTELASVLTYVRQEWGNDAPPVLPETVAEVRTATDGRTAPWSVAELEEYK